MNLSCSDSVTRTLEPLPVPPSGWFAIFRKILSFASATLTPESISSSAKLRSSRPSLTLATIASRRVFSALSWRATSALTSSSMFSTFMSAGTSSAFLISPSGIFISSIADSTSGIFGETSPLSLPAKNAMIAPGSVIPSGTPSPAKVFIKDSSILETSFRSIDRLTVEFGSAPVAQILAL